MCSIDRILFLQTKDFPAATAKRNKAKEMTAAADTRIAELAEDLEGYSTIVIFK